MKVLYIQASPREKLSESRAVADVFIQEYRKGHPGDEIVTLDLFRADLPPFDGPALQAKYNILHGKESSAAEKNAWKRIEAIIEEFKSADKYVFAVPMWNFGIPYRLKQYIDIIVQPGYTFSWSAEEGYKGMVTGKPVTVVYARGGEYTEASGTAGWDLQKRYMEVFLGFVGFTDIHSIVVQPTLAGPDVVEPKRNAAIEESKKAAKAF